jgi:hypothetical protein
MPGVRRKGRVVIWETIVGYVAFLGFHASRTDRKRLRWAGLASGSYWGLWCGRNARALASSCASGEAALIVGRRRLAQVLPNISLQADRER